MTGKPNATSTDKFSQFLKDKDQPITLNKRLKQKFLEILPKKARKLLEPNPEDKLSDAIEAFAEANKGAFFVQIGACDGQAGDLLREHVLTHHWRGVVVEPVPSNFVRLVETYNDLPTVTPRNVAVGDRNGTMPFYSVEAPEDVVLPGWTREIGSFDKSHITKHAALHPGLENYITEIEVESLTFDTLVGESGEANIDFLQTDVEGYDYEILKQINFDRWKPRMVLYEDFHLSAEDREAARVLLETAGYDILKGSMNVLASRREISP